METPLEALDNGFDMGGNASGTWTNYENYQYEDRKPNFTILWDDDSSYVIDVF